MLNIQSWYSSQSQHHHTTRLHKKVGNEVKFGSQWFEFYTEQHHSRSKGSGCPPLYNRELIMLLVLQTYSTHAKAQGRTHIHVRADLLANTHTRANCVQNTHPRKYARKHARMRTRVHTHMPASAYSHAHKRAKNNHTSCNQRI
jgi:hypothetical protein